jgi:hypothetical protein
MKFEHKKNHKDLQEFLGDLPHKHKVELGAVIHSQMYAHIKFFRKRDKAFIAWIATIMKSTSMDEDEYVYKEGETMNEGEYPM